MSDLECRIEALEKTNCLWRYAAGVLGSVLLIGLVTAMNIPDQVPDLLQARRIQVLSPEGKPVIELSANAHGSMLTLLGQGQIHQRTIELAADQEGVRLVLMKNKEAPLLTAQVDDAGSSLALFDGREPSQEPRGILLRSAYPTEDREGGTAVTLTQGWRKAGLQAGLLMKEPPGTAFLLLGGQQGKAVRVSVNQQNGKVEFVDHNQTTLWSTP